MKIALEYDDFSPKNSSFGLLEDIKDHYPNFKVTMFATPWEIRWGEMTPITNEKWKPFVDACKIAIEQGWLELAIHGLTHAPMEFAEISSDEAIKRVLVAEKMFSNVGLKTVKIFKAPFWALSEQGEEAIQSADYYIAKDGYYHWNLANPLPENFPTDKIMIAHGHVQNTMENGLEETMDKILSLPTDTEFYFLSEAVLKDGKTK